MKHRLFFCAVTIASSILSTPLMAQITPPDPVQQRVERIRDRFIVAIKRCGETPTFIPIVLVDNLESGISYDQKAVHVSRWSKLDPSIQQAMQAWAAKGTLGLSAEGQWGEIFNDLLVAHELGHYLEGMSNRLQGLDHAQGEIDADEIALAFWSLDEADKKRLPSRIENYTAFLYALPNPVPAGQDAGQYFESQYDNIQNSLPIYGWYQGQFMKTAWQAYGRRSFCDWVAANKPVPLDQLK